MRLQRLTGLEQDKIIGEYRDVMAQIADCWTSWPSPNASRPSSRKSWSPLKQEFGQTKVGERRSQIEHNAQELGTEDLITPTDMVVTLSHTGYIKSQALSEYRASAAAAAASRPPPPRKTTGSTSSSSPTRTTGSCASPTAVAYWLGRSGEVPQARATRAASPSSTCSAG